MTDPAPLLQVDGLTCVFSVRPHPVTAVNALSFSVGRGQTVGLVGESGSGKSATALATLRLLDPPAHITAGAVRLGGHDLLTLPEAEMRRVRGAKIGLVFQEPMAALNPVMRIGTQIAEGLIVHGLATRREARQRAIELLDAVKIADPAKRVDDYPHQLSGGMQQRVMLAIALACRPPLLIADEPTTALDVTVQAQVLDLLRRMKDEFALSVLLISHDLGVVAETADRVVVMYAGRAVEEGSVRTVLREPKHPYTQGLLASIPGTSRGRRLQAIQGTVPSPGQLPVGCAFAPRCPHRMEVCDSAPPALTRHDGSQVRCYLYSAERDPHPNDAAATLPVPRRGWWR